MRAYGRVKSSISKPPISQPSDAPTGGAGPASEGSRSPRGGRPRKVHMREVLNTLLYLNRSGCQWDMLPHDLLPKSTVYDYFVQCCDDGTWAKMVKCCASGRV